MSNETPRPNAGRERLRRSMQTLFARRTARQDADPGASTAPAEDDARTVAAPPDVAQTPCRPRGGTRA